MATDTKELNIITETLSTHYICTIISDIILDIYRKTRVVVDVISTF